MTTIIPPSMEYSTYVNRSKLKDAQRSHSYPTTGSLCVSTTVVENNTSRTIMLIDRSGIVTPHEPVASGINMIAFCTDIVTIRKIHEFRSRSVMESTVRLLENSIGVADNGSNEPSQVLRHLKEVLRNSPAATNISIQLTYEIDTGGLTNASPRRYIENLDLVIDTYFEQSFSVHPHSPNGQHISSFLKSPRNLECLHVDIDIIDNSNSIGERFTNILGQVVKITPRKDPSKDNGLHLSMSGLNEKGEPGFSNDVVALDSMLDLKVFPTAEQAHGYGNAAEKLKQDNSVLEASLHQASLRSKEEHTRAMSELQSMREADKVRFEAAIAQIRSDATARQAASDLEHQTAMNRLKQEASMASIRTDTMKDTASIDTIRHKAAIEAIIDGIDIHHKKSVRDIDMGTKLINAIPAVVSGAAAAVIAMKLLGDKSSFSDVGFSSMSGIGGSSW